MDISERKIVFQTNKSLDNIDNSKTSENLKIMDYSKDTPLENLGNKKGSSKL